MQKCSYCGRENADNAEYCYECGTAFHIEGETEEIEEAGTFFGFVSCPICPWVKWGLYFAAWGVVALATISRNTANLLAILAFPIGLLGIMPANIAVMTAWLAGWAAIISGWTIYAVLTVAIGKVRRVGVFSLLYILFCVLLVLNVTGCEKILKTAASIH